MKIEKRNLDTKNHLCLTNGKIPFWPNPKENKDCHLGQLCVKSHVKPKGKSESVP